TGKRSGRSPWFSNASKIFCAVFLPIPFTCSNFPVSIAFLRLASSVTPNSLYNKASRLPPRPGSFNKGSNPAGTSSSNVVNNSEVPVAKKESISSSSLFQYLVYHQYHLFPLKSVHLFLILATLYDKQQYDTDYCLVIPNK